MRALIFCLGLVFSVHVSFGQKLLDEHDPQVDFSRLKTFGWIKRDKIPIVRPDPSEDDAALDARLNEEILTLLKTKLEAKGFAFSEESPDFLVGYVAVARFSMSGSEFGLDTQGGPDPSYTSYGHWRPFYKTGSDANLRREGTLLIDMVNPDSNKLIWRGTAKDTIDNRKKAPAKVEKAVNKLLARFPPR